MDRNSDKLISELFELERVKDCLFLKRRPKKLYRIGDRSGQEYLVRSMKESKNGKWRLRGIKPYYETGLGAAYLGDAQDLMNHLSPSTVDLIITSPPFALVKKKEYGNVDADQYLWWFGTFAQEFWRILKTKGSLVIHLGGSWNKGKPTKALYHFKLLILLCEKFHLAQDFYWFNPAKLPTPAEWVTVRRVRVKDAVDPIWWLSKSPHPKADNRRVLKPYSESMKQLLKDGYEPKLRPSGHDISDKFQKDLGGSIPPNLLELSNTESNSPYLKGCRAGGMKPHPARYPSGIPRFFTQFLTREGDKVLDPFGGSNVTGEVAERLGRKWMCFERNQEYLEGSKFRFNL